MKERTELSLENETTSAPTAASGSDSSTGLTSGCSGCSGASMASSTSSSTTTITTTGQPDSIHRQKSETSNQVSTSRSGSSIAGSSSGGGGGGGGGRDPEMTFYFSSTSNSEGEEESASEESSSSTSSSSGSPSKNQPNSTPAIHKSSTLTQVPPSSAPQLTVTPSSPATTLSGTRPTLNTTLKPVTHHSASVGSASQAMSAATPILIKKSNTDSPMSQIAANASLTYRLLHHRLLNSSSTSLSHAGTPIQTSGGGGELSSGSLADRSFSDFLGRTFATGTFNLSLSLFLSLSLLNSLKSCINYG